MRRSDRNVTTAFSPSSELLRPASPGLPRSCKFCAQTFYHADPKEGRCPECFSKLKQNNQKGEEIMLEDQCVCCGKELVVRKYGPDKNLCMVCVRKKIVNGELKPVVNTRKEGSKRKYKPRGTGSKGKKKPPAGDTPILPSQESYKKTATLNAMKMIYEMRETVLILPSDVRRNYTSQLEMVWVWMATAFPELLSPVLDNNNGE